MYAEREASKILSLELQGSSSPKVFTRSSERKRATAHPAVTLNPLSPLLSRASSSTSSDTDHVLWLVGVEAAAASPYLMLAVSTEIRKMWLTGESPTLGGAYLVLQIYEH